MPNLPTLLAILTIATALPAQATWSRLYPNSAPQRRMGHAMAFDEQLGDVVLFGGREANGTTFFNDLWAWNGQQWRLLTSTGVPPARNGHRMVYDSVRQVLVLWGGQNSSTELTDTWERVGTQWIQRNPTQRPPRRLQFGMTFDQARGRTVLFGGGFVNPMNDTWEWDGINWQQRVTPVAPIPRSGPMLAYDPVRQVSVLFGGGVTVNGNSFQVADTWTWDGSEWRVLQPAHPPQPASNIEAVWDEARGRLVTGPFSPAFTPLFLSWEWDGQDWRILFQSPPGQGLMA